MFVLCVLFVTVVDRYLALSVVFRVILKESGTSPSSENGYLFRLRTCTYELVTALIRIPTSVLQLLVRMPE